MSRDRPFIIILRFKDNLKMSLCMKYRARRNIDRKNIEIFIRLRIFIRYSLSIYIMRDNRNVLTCVRDRSFGKLNAAVNGWLKRVSIR